MLFSYQLARCLWQWIGVLVRTRTKLESRTGSPAFQDNQNTGLPGIEWTVLLARHLFSSETVP